MERKGYKNQELISKIKLAEKFYMRAASDAKGELLKKLFDLYARVKRKYYRELIVENTNNGKVYPSLNIGPDAKTLNKINVELDQISFSNELDKLLVYCLRLEEELIIVYQKELTTGKIHSDQRIIYNNHLRESLILYNQLKMVKESMHYNDSIINPLII